MAVDSIYVDTLSLDDFGTSLQARLEEAFSAKIALTNQPATDLPQLGTFEDATTTAQRSEGLRQQFAARLDLLLGTLIAAHTASVVIAAQYRSADALAAASVTAIRETLQPADATLGVGTGSNV